MPYKDPEKRKTYHKEASARWARENRERRRESNRRSDARRAGTPERNRQHAEVRHRRQIRNKIAVIELYGGCCAFCGDDRLEVLTVDHIQGDGKDHRAEIQGQYRGIYDFLSRTDHRPDLYRLLCGSCHLAHTNYNVSPGNNEFRPLGWWKEYSALRRRANGS